MQISRTGVARGVVLLALLVLISSPSAFADLALSPFEPVEARIKPPSGLTSSEPSFLALIVEWLRVQARIHIPVG
jgi:hypothetical protein